MCQRHQMQSSAASRRCSKFSRACVRGASQQDCATPAAFTSIRAAFGTEEVRQPLLSLQGAGAATTALPIRLTDRSVLALQPGR